MVSSLGHFADTKNNDQLITDAISNLSEAEIAMLERAIEDAPAPRTAVAVTSFKKKQVPIGVAGTDIEILELSLNGYMPSEISTMLDIEISNVRAILRKKINQEFINSTIAESHEALRACAVEMVGTIRGLLRNNDPKIRLGVVRELAKINGLYSDGPTVQIGAEDIVRDVLSVARESLEFATRSQSARSAPNLDRFINATIIEDNGNG